jgi:hypothetical protein
VTFKGKGMFADPFTLVLQSKATPISCQQRAPPRWKVDGKWIYRYPGTAPCAEPDPVPVKAQAKARAAAGLEETVWNQQKDVYHRRMAERMGSWGVGMPPEVLEKVSAMVGHHWLLGYKVLGLATTTAVPVMIGISAVEMPASVIMRAIVIYRHKGLGPWILVAAWG